MDLNVAAQYGQGSVQKSIQKIDEGSLVKIEEILKECLGTVKTLHVVARDRVGRLSGYLPEKASGDDAVSPNDVLSQLCSLRVELQALSRTIGQL